MKVVLGLLGVALLISVLADALLTTLVVRAGAGPPTGGFTRLAWRGMHRLSGHRRGSQLLTVVRDGLLVLTVVQWVGLLWAGWTLVFLSANPAVVDPRTSDPANIVQVVYYTAFVIFSLGVGDYVAASHAWRGLTALATFTGLFLVTLAITYLVSVVSAVVHSRTFALQIHALGGTATDIVCRGWGRASLQRSLPAALTDLPAHLALTAENHLAYPVLRFFHIGSPRTAAPLAVAALDEALLLLTAAVAPQARPPVSATEPLRQVIGRYLETASSPAPQDQVSPPEPPPIASLEAAGIPLTERREFAAALVDQSDRRATLKRAVEAGGWSWAQ
jgi:hypothetical protein